MRFAVIFFVTCLVITVLGAGAAFWIKYGPPLVPKPRYEILSREAFTNAWLTRGADSFVATYGPPASKYNFGPNQEAWIYHNLTYEPVTGQRDRRVEVIIWAGQAVGEIRFP